MSSPNGLYTLLPLPARSELVYQLHYDMRWAMAMSLRRGGRLMLMPAASTITEEEDEERVEETQVHEEQKPSLTAAQGIEEGEEEEEGSVRCCGAFDCFTLLWGRFKAWVGSKN